MPRGLTSPPLWRSIPISRSRANSRPSYDDPLYSRPEDFPMTSRFRVFAPVLLVLLLAPALRAVPQGGVDKTLFVAVLDENGRPVRNFTADDILIREDGQ